jgi:hypothetical protein
MAGSVAYPHWRFYPRHRPSPDWVAALVDLFAGHAGSLNTLNETGEHHRSDNALRLLAPLSVDRVPLRCSCRFDLKRYTQPVVEGVNRGRLGAAARETGKDPRRKGFDGDGDSQSIWSRRA